MATNALKESAARALRPPLKWAGGKRWLVPLLRPIWAGFSDRRLVEPLCGGMAVTVELVPERALLNDINPHLINFFRWLKKGLRIGLSMKNESDAYYACRERFNRLLGAGKSRGKQAAELFYYLNRTGYNGLCRFNSRGEFNVPFGRYREINYRRNFTAYKSVLRDWEFTAGDFERVPLEPDDFIYADPPYDVEFTRYAKQDFGWEDQVRLAKWLARHPGPVVLSNQATERVVALYERLGFHLLFTSLDGPRRISCNGDRTPAKEVLATRGI